VRVRYLEGKGAVERGDGMNVTIIEAGNMGRGIGTRLIAGGNDVEIVDRDPGEARALAEELGGKAENGGSATALEPGDEIGGDVVVLALYYAPELEAVEQYRNQLAGKVVVDISNPVEVESFDRLVTPPDSSAAEEIAKLVPTGTPVVKAFHTTFAGTLVAGESAGQQLDVLIAGDDEDAKNKVAALARDGGLNPIDVGPQRRARELEAAGLLHMGLQGTLGTGFASALKIVT
jgi:NADPH-dependent F420 reductase